MPPAKKNKFPGFFPRGEKDIKMVVFDEIGLAENSPFNPLKVLHALLEDKI